MDRYLALLLVCEVLIRQVIFIYSTIILYVYVCVRVYIYYFFSPLRKLAAFSEDFFRHPSGFIKVGVQDMGYIYFKTLYVINFDTQLSIKSIYGATGELVLEVYITITCTRFQVFVHPLSMREGRTEFLYPSFTCISVAVSIAMTTFLLQSILNLKGPIRITKSSTYVNDPSGNQT